MLNIKEVFILIDEGLLRKLACPGCKGELEQVKPDDEAATPGLLCKECAIVFPVRDNIPILLLDEAKSV
jgi:hypothetical protein